MLSLSHVYFDYGGVHAVSDLTMEVESKSITSLIGPNGAGKTTTFNLICGEIHPLQGKIYFRGAEIDRLSPHQIAATGIGRTFQNIHLFPSLTVKEHMAVSQYIRYRSSLIQSLLEAPLYREEKKVVSRRTNEIMEKVGLEEYADEPAVNLPYGLQRRVEFGRAMAVGTVFMLLDEPTAGMNIQESNEMMEMIRSLTDLGMTILLVEHDMKVVMSISTKVWVMDQGIIIASGTPEEIKKDPRVIKAYLGE
ncbi:MAG TPA: ABC transporter ATP-binding protein [Thermodesulfobacteriota bacterium]|nr:ABC transporter ATP-binding protein [Thermodesulfobacteriota bacterium]